MKDGYIGYDAHFSSKHLFSDNPDFRGLYNRTGYNHDYEFEVDYQFNEYGHRSEALIGGQNHFLVIGGSQTFGFGSRLFVIRGAAGHAFRISLLLCWPLN